MAASPEESIFRRCPFCFGNGGLLPLAGIEEERYPACSLKRILKRIILLEKSVAKNIEMTDFSLVIERTVMYNL